MQGTIFTLFNDLVTDQFGIEMWNELLHETQPQSQGVYTSALQYDDSELINMVVLLSQKTDIPTNTLVKEFGIYLFPKLATQSPVAIEPSSSMHDLLNMVGSVIHREVKRLYPDSYLPTIKYEDIEKYHGNLIYQSKRQLCMLCEGLIEGAGNYLQTDISICQTTCMHNGDDHCTLSIQLH